MSDTPPPRRSRTLRRVLILVAVVLAACCGGAAATGFFLYRWYNGEAGPAQATTNEYLGDLETGRPAAAYALTCPDFRSRVTEHTFTEAESTPPRGHRIVSSSVSTVNGQRSALITVSLTRAGGSTDRITLPLAVVDGRWYVCPEIPVP
jgi:hypothetical protein